MATTTKLPRRIDRNRRERIITAAIEVMEQDGVHALTHRRAAAAAGVPLAATTYYFDSIGDLLSAALQQIGARYLADLRERVDTVPEGSSLAPLLAQFICTSATPDSRTGSLVTEFWSTALRHDEVREVVLSLDAGEMAILEPRLGKQAARAALAASSGLIQQALLTRQPPSEDEMTEIMHRILHDRD